ncbi:3,4-dihydroxy-2-butanone-4-phosphate synthase [Geodermatophilus ruber]|uniref:3,4-dihydroxy-2-butanone-4-phosphate synthase n=1 Tax=Geodermatophilus ruber TaxID=504800 RepID=A0A1I4AHS3_9ACTN|nr:3,4-dihydroxy-2-butanone-4-phosphate synthase [Geodermatophilus ruber]SFK55326.1 3,4-dihydroxy 2-butanone 4-phosphate synthase / GTP cyclohydrolase II [Geodermatophilus ruber]
MTGAVLAERTEMVDGAPSALAALRRGEPVVLTHARERHLVIAAERVTGRTMALLVRYSSGFACVAIEGERLAALDIPLMEADDAGREAFAVSVDAGAGLTTGISALERARTVRALAHPSTTPADLVRPGHVVPVQVRPGGVLERPAPPEAAADLCRLAGLVPAAVFAAIPESVSEPLPTALADLTTVRVEDVVRHRERAEPLVHPAAVAPLATRRGLLTQHTYVDVRGGTEHLAVVAGAVADADAVPVRVHDECLAGDLLGSVRCRCAGDLAAALDAVATAGNGVVVYVRGGAACGGQPTGVAVPADRDRVAAHVLRDLGVRSVVLLTDDHGHAGRLSAFGMPVVACAPLTPAGQCDLRAGAVE